MKISCQYFPYKNIQRIEDIISATVSLLLIKTNVIMERRRHLSREEMLRAVGMIEAGSRQRTVALALNTSQSVISRLWPRY